VDWAKQVRTKAQQRLADVISTRAAAIVILHVDLIAYLYCFKSFGHSNTLAAAFTLRQPALSRADKSDGIGLSRLRRTKCSQARPASFV
jgi:hypothetical protein